MAYRNVYPGLYYIYVKKQKKDWQGPLPVFYIY